MKKSLTIKIIIFFAAILGCTLLHAQKGGIPLADEYYKEGEFAKAADIYVNFTQDFDKASKVYANYTDCLFKLEKAIELEKFLKKMIKWDAVNPVYKIDLGHLYTVQGKSSEAKKTFEKAILSTKNYPEIASKTANYFQSRGYVNFAKQVYIMARKWQSDDYIFTLELAEIYKIEKSTDEMVAELVRLLLMNQNDKEFLKSKFQDFITTDEEFKKFENYVYERIQTDPSQTLYNELLIWVYVQQKLFDRAFLQAKAYDKLMKLPGSKCMETARIAFDNKDYATAGEMFEYIATEYKNSPHYATARKMRIQSREEVVKNTYPINSALIRSLIQNYHSIVVEMPRSLDAADAYRSMGLLYGFYLNHLDSAIICIEKALTYAPGNQEFTARCKTDLGDIYLLKGEPWEATLLYSQVEKIQKDAPLGYMAKLKNAKLSYYTGQFELAKEHLNVLKLATHREIANDALELALFIQDNTVFDDDSTHPALSAYAGVELLLFQNKYPQALEKLDSILQQYKNTTLTDEIYFLKAKVYKKLAQYDQSLLWLDKISTDFKHEIYGDDAAFMRATITEEFLREREKAMQLYQQFLIDYPASIYTAEARKRFRILRGDNL